MNQRSAGLVLLVMIGCAPTLMVNGFTLDEYQWKRDRWIVHRQATFDLDCPAGDVTLTVLNAGSVGATNVGAAGCTRRVRYLRLGNTEQWIRQD